MHTMFSAPGNSRNFDERHLPDSAMFYGIVPDSAMFYGIVGIGQCNGVRHHHPVPSLDRGVAPGSNIYNPYSTPSSANRGSPHGPSHQLPSSSNHPVIGVSTDEYGRENHFYIPYSTPSSANRGFPVSIYHGPSHQLPSSSNHPVIGASADEYGREYHFYNPYSTPSSGNRGFPVSINHGPSHQWPSSSNHPVIGVSTDDYGRENHFNNPYSTPSSGNRGFPVSIYHGPSNQLPSSSNHSVIGVSTDEYGKENHFYNPYSTPSSGNRGFPVGLDSVLAYNLHHPPPPMLGARSHFHPQALASSYGLATIGPRGPMPPQVGVEAGPRHPGPVRPTGIRTHRSHRGEVAPEATSRHVNLPHLSMLPAEEVAILNLSAFHEVGEGVGIASSGLSEESITNGLKTRIYKSSTCLNLEEAASMDEENDRCIICQEEYQNQEKIGFLACGHEYHADCLKKWLLVKNVCPLCKAPAMTLKRKDV